MHPVNRTDNVLKVLVPVKTNTSCARVGYINSNICKQFRPFVWIKNLRMFAWIKLIAYAGFSGLMPSILRHNGIKRILHTSDSEILLPMKKNELHSDNLIRALEIRKETYLGTIDPYYSSDYFIHNETDYLNENLPEYYNVHRRNQSICKGDTISNFYKTHFCQNNSSNMAIIVPYEHLDKLKTIFEKNIILGRYESLEDFCIFPPFQIKSRKQYDSIVDLSSDRELWELDRPLFSKIQTKNKSKTIVLDVIIRSKYNSPESVTMNELAHRMWRESYGVASGWHNSGVRCDIPEHNPHFLLGTTKFMSGYKNRQYAHNFPVRGVHNGDRQDSAALLRYEKNIRRVCAYLQKHCNGCGWFTGTPQFSSLGHTDPTKTNRLTGRGKEWQYVLPADEQQVRVHFMYYTLYDIICDILGVGMGTKWQCGKW